MIQLLFAGRVINGCGRHAELGIPGRSALPTAPDDWPESLFPGSLNVRVTEYPREFSERGLVLSVRTLDTGEFKPAFVIAQDAMVDNKLTPRPDNPKRGTAQVWRAALLSGGAEVRCWVLRRIGSGLGQDLELVAGIGLRDACSFATDREWRVQVRMEGDWHVFQPTDRADGASRHR